MKGGHIVKHFYLALLCSIVLLTSFYNLPLKTKTNIHIATCNGNSSCYACKNCKYCGHCNQGGGTCGVCSSRSVAGTQTLTRNSISNTGTSVSSQCKGITKKGLRCKRMVKGGGYCFQHS
jgi:hypothetical protein